jgi:hypothetical protein
VCEFDIFTTLYLLVTDKRQSGNHEECKKENQMDNQPLRSRELQQAPHPEDGLMLIFSPCPPRLLPPSLLPFPSPESSEAFSGSKKGGDFFASFFKKKKIRKKSEKKTLTFHFTLSSKDCVVKK